MKKLFHGVAYYPELWPDADVSRDIAEMKKIGINVVRLGEFAWAKMEPDEGRISLDYFVGLMDRLHKEGIDVVFCTPTAAPPIWLTHDRPERCVVDCEGQRFSHGARQHASYENPDVRAACFRIAESCARAVGKHPALIGWQIDNELKCHVGEDFSPSALRQWTLYLKKRYGEIDRLNALWGTEVWSERYQTFEQVPAPVRTPFLHNASLSTAYRLFSRERIAEFVGEQAAIIRAHSAAPITHNTSPGFSVNLERLLRNLDFASFDLYPRSEHWSTLVFDCDLFRAAKPGRPFWLMETSVSHNGWLGQHEPAHPPGFLVAEAVCAYALGAEAVCYWLWRQQRSGCELSHSAVLSSWFKPTLGYQEVETVEAARKKLEPWFLRSRPAKAEIAVTWSDIGRAMIQTEPLGGSSLHRIDYLQCVRQWHEQLLQLGLDREVRFEEATLEDLKVLITPFMPRITLEFLDKIESFVRAGGIWICGPVTGSRTEEHTVPIDAALGAIEKLAGVETVFSFPVTDTGAVGEAFDCRSPLVGWCSAFRSAGADTKILGQLQSELAPGLGFLSERKLGQGSVIVLAAQTVAGGPGYELLRRLIGYVVKQAQLKVRMSATMGTLVCPRIHESGYEFLLVVNLDGRGGEVNQNGRYADLVTGAELPAGQLKLDRYEWRLVRAMG